MTHITRLTVTSFRSHNKKKVKFSPRTTIIAGKNGIGKTSLLEAIYVTLQGKSFKGPDKEIIKHTHKWWRTELEFNDGATQGVMVSLDDEAIEKNYLVNDKKTKRIPKKNIYPIVLFEPNDLFLFHGSPSKRRDYIDRFITQIDPQYTNILNRYEKALRQRNALLKQGITDTSKYFPWEVILSEYGASIVARRARLIEKINTLITKKYKTISNNKDVITIETHYTPLTYTSEQFLEDLSQSFNKDLIVKHTTVGPHRHDIYFKINNQPIEATASRGELRTTLLALKFIEAEIIEDIIKKKPIILLDDVFSELDEERQAQLLSLENQTIITTTEGYPAHQKRESNIKTIQLR